MRADIQKVLCERPRRKFNEGRPPGYRNKNYKPIRRLRLIEIEDLDGKPTLDEVQAPRQTSMVRFGKQLSDHLAPLKGWARKQVGRPYATAMQDIHRLLKGNGVLQQHVRDHVDDFIIPRRKVEIVNDRACHSFRFGTREILDVELYEDPRDGIIKWGQGSPHRWERKYGLRASPSDLKLRHLPQKNGVKVSLPDTDTEHNRFLIRVHGVWMYNFLRWEETQEFWPLKPRRVLREHSTRCTRETFWSLGFHKPKKR